MFDFLFAIITQSLTFLPLAFGIGISYHVLRATDMTIDGSFVVGAAVFARLITLGYSPSLAAFIAIACGAFAGMLSATIQRGGRVDPLLAGVLATFILASLNLVIMGRPNISLLSVNTLVSAAFLHGELQGWTLVSVYTFVFCFLTYLIMRSRFGLGLRAFGDNPTLFKRLGKPVERYRLAGFGLSNALAAASGCLTAQTLGYADVSMGFGMTLTGIGTVILGQQLLSRIKHQRYLRIGAEFIACLLGVLLYFFALNLLLRLDVNPIYLKMILGIMLVIFLRSAVSPGKLEKSA
jgi:putative tryptophan/tyrosine transport system permease protein